MDYEAPFIELPQEPSILRWMAGFIAVGIAWGLTTPFMRRAAVNHVPPDHPSVRDPKNSAVMRVILGLLFAVIDMLRRPAYAIPFLLNVTGSVWFFLLIGKAELSLMVPITNSLAFLFTVLGEWWAEGKAVTKDTWVGMAFVLTGIALCVHSKS